ncbi:hypothetical protein P8452_37581 [Trifolium repens]|nr:hypothetical protein P8452_37581 [Trifolium repens]
MKIQCDACQKQEASLFCPADEAALCNHCDHTIHQANKLSAKHKRFSLHHPTSKDIPLCDICKERRAYLFCKEDRAILCRECDIPIHRDTQLTKKHNRFLITGVKIGAAVSSSDPTTSNGSEVRTSLSRESQPSSFSSENNHCSRTFKDNMAYETISTSSISEYLIESIPGYSMEDLFDASFAPSVFYKDYQQNQDHRVTSMCDSVPQYEVRSPQLSLSASVNVPQIDSLDGVMKMLVTKAVEGYSSWRYLDR